MSRSTSFPYLQVARANGVDYGTVLSVVDFLEQARPPTSATEHQKRGLRAANQIPGLMRCIVTAWKAENRRRRERDDYMVGEYHADYSEVTETELMANDPELEDLLRNAKTVR